MSKMVKVLTKGPIYAKGGVYGPIETPYKEDERTIFNMISRGIKVVEILRDGTELSLTPLNFDKDNEKKTEKIQPAVNTQIIDETPIKVVEGDAAGEKVDEVVNHNQHQHQNNNQHNHNHNNNNGKFNNQKNNKPNGNNNQKNNNVVADEIESK